MIIVLQKGATQEQMEHIIERVKKLGLSVHLSQGVERTIIGVIGPEDILRVTPLEAFPGVEKVLPVLAPYRLVSREFKPENSVVDLGKNVKIGDNKVIVMAGPCAIENRRVLGEIASSIKGYGAVVLRGGAFKPRTSPYSFQGLGKEGLEYLKEVGDEFGMVTVTEVIDPRDVNLVAQYADVLQIGARNMQNFNLLREVGAVRKPILLKRGMSSTIKEWLMSAEYILSEGNFDVVLCERGIRTFEDFTRNTLDVSSIPSVKSLSHLPVIADPSHAGGKWGLVAPLSKAALAAGCDGLIIEVHSRPEEALSDGSQSLLPERFSQLMQELKLLAKAIGREL